MATYLERSNRFMLAGRFRSRKRRSRKSLEVEAHRP